MRDVGPQEREVHYSLKLGKLIYFGGWKSMKIGLGI